MYTGDDIYVKCGKCKACLQEKANARSQRIKTEYDSDHIVLFVTLTYDRTSCPYVKFDDVMAKKEILPVWRAYTVRRVPYLDKDGNLCYRNRRVYGETKLFEKIMPDYDFLLSGFPFLQKFGSRIGVCWFKDVQNFVKRLRTNFKRFYGYSPELRIYQCTEYGSDTKRPHAHLLLFARPNDEEKLRNAIVASWPFARPSRTRKYIELARDAASYVSSYVNCGDSLHPFLSKNFAPKHSYSKYFGHSHELFTLDGVLQAVERNDMSFVQRGSSQTSSVSVVPLPKYVVNRFFPLFKGSTRLSDDALLQFIRCPKNYGSIELLPCVRKPRNGNLDIEYVDYSPEDMLKIAVRIGHAYEYYRKHLPLSDGYKTLDDYAIDYIRVWRCYRSTCHRLWRSDDKVDDIYKFDNVVDLISGRVKSPYHVDMFQRAIDSGKFVTADVNAFPQNVSKTYSLSDLYDKKDKSKKLINHCMANSGHWV